MLFSYLKLTVRSLLRTPFFTFINVAGLSIGFGVFIVLWQYTEHELNSDRQWKDWERIARVGFWWEWTDNGRNWEGYYFAGSNTDLAARVSQDYPQIEDFTRLIHQSNFQQEFVGFGPEIAIRYERPDGTSVIFREEEMVCADPSLFEFFSIPLVKGNPSSVLTQPNALVVNQSTATRYFGGEDPIGKEVAINGRNFQVTGVFEDLPGNSHLWFGLVISNSPYIRHWNTFRPVPIASAYIKSREVVSWEEFEEEINRPDALERYWGEAFRMFPNAKGHNALQSLEEVVFSNWTGNPFDVKSRPMLLIFQAVGWAVLLVSVFNFLNLNTSRTMSRLKEIATRRISGAGLFDFLKQFTIEASVIFMLAIAVAFTIIQLTSDIVMEFLNIPVAMPGKKEIAVVLVTAVAAIALSSLSPVFKALAYRPRLLLSGSVTLPRMGKRMATLTVFQYVAAIVLMVWGFMMNNQLSFLLGADLGYDRQRVVVIEDPVLKPDNFNAHWNAFKGQLSDHAGIAGVTACTSIMGDVVERMTLQRIGTDNPVVVDTNGGMDEQFIPFFDLQLIAGRNFRPDDHDNVIILSEGAVRRLDFDNPGAAVGSRVRVLRTQIVNTGESDWVDVEVIGVVKSYRLRPMIKFGNENDKLDRGIALTYKNYLVSTLTGKQIIARLDSHDFNTVMSGVQREFDALFPGRVFSWYSLDENITRQYQTEESRRNQILFFTGLAIVLASLGLLGMMENTTAKRTKEIGIRKVLGAKIHEIAYLLMSSTLWQLFISALIGIPVAAFLTQQYIQRFTEQITQQWWHYALPVMILAVIMFGTVSAILLKAARRNPVDTLRCE